MNLYVCQKLNKILGGGTQGSNMSATREQFFAYAPAETCCFTVYKTMLTEIFKNFAYPIFYSRV